MSKANISIICDNGGGITLQVVHGKVRFQHNYNDAMQCATDIKEAVAEFPNLRLADWEGNEASEGWLEPTDDEIRNGGYRVLSPEDFDTNESIEWACGWHNVSELADSMGV